MRRPPTMRQAQAFAAVLRCGGQSAAARELGITQGAVHTLVMAYCWNTHTDPLSLPEGQNGRLRYRGLICSIEDCGRPEWAQGWCGMHYRRWLRHGSPLALARAA